MPSKKEEAKAKAREIAEKAKFEYAARQEAERVKEERQAARDARQAKREAEKAEREWWEG